MRLPISLWRSLNTPDTAVRSSRSEVVGRPEMSAAIEPSDSFAPSGSEPFIANDESADSVASKRIVRRACLPGFEAKNEQGSESSRVPGASASVAEERSAWRGPFGSKGAITSLIRSGIVIPAADAAGPQRDDSGVSDDGVTEPETGGTNGALGPFSGGGGCMDGYYGGSEDMSKAIADFCLSGMCQGVRI